MKLDAVLGQRGRRGRGVWPFFLAPLNRLIGNEPGIAATTAIAPARVRPARNVAFVLIWNAEREPVDRCFSLGREMKNVFMAVVQETLRVNRFEMSEGRCAGLCPRPALRGLLSLGERIEL